MLDPMVGPDGRSVVLNPVGKEVPYEKTHIARLELYL